MPSHTPASSHSTVSGAVLSPPVCGPGASGGAVNTPTRAELGLGLGGHVVQDSPEETFHLQRCLALVSAVGPNRLAVSPRAQ